MMSEAAFWRFAADLPEWAVWGAALIVAGWFVTVFFELPRTTLWKLAVVGTGALAAVFVLIAVLRPVRVEARPHALSPRVVVMLDASRRLLLPAESGGDESRLSRANDAIGGIEARFSDARVEVLALGGGELRDWSATDSPWGVDSEISSGFDQLLAPGDQRPEAVVLVSDGRVLDSPKVLEAAAERLGVPVHTVALAREHLDDVSIRSIQGSGTVVAHQPFTLSVDVACDGALECPSLPVEVRDVATRSTLAQAMATPPPGGVETLELEVTLDGIGARVLEVTLGVPADDEVPANNRRFVTLNVTRDRVRILHIAGRPNYDVRALRRWLERDESLDVVAFFILRDREDNPRTFSDRELALIPFPVDELFTTHLSSFDAVILQDIDADKHGFAFHLPRLAKYVRGGGGLILVGGPEMFGGGGYAGSAIDSVLPVSVPRTAAPFDASSFVPQYTEVGRRAPLLAGLRSVLGDELPEFRGSNALGPARPGAWVLWERPATERHPGSRGGTSTPVLAVWGVEQGRAITLGVNDTQRLAYGELAARSGGRAYSELWQGLVGWLMQDPRYEMFQISMPDSCVAEEPFELVLHPSHGDVAGAQVRVKDLVSGEQVAEQTATGTGPLVMPPLPAGAYAAAVESGGFPAARMEFACEEAGGAFRDSRPGPLALRALSDELGTAHVRYDEVSALPRENSEARLQIASTTPLAPAWFWAILAGVALGVHWLVRRQSDVI